MQRPSESGRLGPGSTRHSSHTAVPESRRLTPAACRQLPGWQNPEQRCGYPGVVQPGRESVLAEKSKRVSPLIRGSSRRCLGVLRGLSIGLKIVRPEGASLHNHGPGVVGWLIGLGALPETSPSENSETSGSANGEMMRYCSKIDENWHTHRGFGCSRLPCGIGLSDRSAQSFHRGVVGWPAILRDYSTPSVVPEAKRTVKTRRPGSREQLQAPVGVPVFINLGPNRHQRNR
jgi:hypothetical protein